MSKGKYSNDAYVHANAEVLISRDLWVPAASLAGEHAVLTHPHFEDAFKAIMQQHVKTSEVCLLSLCTARRPYSTSTKYRAFIAEFGGACDIVINSNGGVVPLSFETSYPFMTYNAKRASTTYDDLYVRTVGYRVNAFLRKFEYQYVVANFHAEQRNYLYARPILRRLYAEGVIDGFAFVPSVVTRKTFKMFRKEYRHRLFPDLHPLVWGSIVEAVRNPKPGVYY